MWQSSACLPEKYKRFGHCNEFLLSLVWTLAFNTAAVSDDSTSSISCLPSSVLKKSCMPPHAWADDDIFTPEFASDARQPCHSLQVKTTTEEESRCDDDAVNGGGGAAVGRCCVGGGACCGGGAGKGRGRGLGPGAKAAAADGGIRGWG